MNKNTGGSSFRQPATPNIPELISGQLDLNREVAGDLDLLNRANLVGPFGTSTFGVNDGRVQITTTPSPEAQRALNQRYNAQNTLYNLFQDFRFGADSIIREPFDIGDLEDIGDLVASVNLQTDIPNILDLTEAGQPVEDATYNLLTRRMDPFYEERERRLVQDLANRGLPVGGEAREGAIGRFERGMGEQYLNAADRAVLAGRDERARLFQAMLGEAQFENLATLQGAEFQNRARQQGINEALAERNANLSTLFGLAQGATGFTPMPQAAQAVPISYAAPDLLGSELSLYGLQSRLAQAQDAARREEASQNNQALASLLGAGIRAGFGAFA